MNKTERIILIDLYQSVDGLYGYTFYSRYKMKPSLLFNFIEKYVGKGIIIYENDRLCLTEDGRNVILKQHFNYQNNGSRFKNIPAEFVCSKMEINAPYLPNINYLSKEIIEFKKAE